MNLPIVQSLWIGSALSQVEKLCVQSFIDHGHEFHLYTYDVVGGVPDGAIIKDGNEILPADKIFRHAGGSYAPFADWFRYALLNQKGGYWADMDMVCLKPLTFDDEIIVTEGGDGLYTNSLLRFPPAHPFMRAMAQVCAEYKDPHKARFGSIGGPRAITKMILRHNLQAHAKPFTYFVPLSAAQWMHAFNQTFAGSTALFPDTHCIHLSNEPLRRAGFDKNAQFDEDSLFEQLKRKHHIAPLADAKRITSDDLAAMVVDKRLYKFERRTARKRKTAAAVTAMAVATALIALAVFYWG